MDKAALILRGISKAFGKNTVLKDINIDILNGEFIVLLGPSGCGKTTLLNAISGLNMPDSGAIELLGKDISKLPTNKRDMGVVFQSYALFPHMNVKQNVAFGLRMRKVNAAEIDERVKDALNKVQLSGFENRRIEQMSGGQRQRVALARALVLNPSLLLMDEPLSNLDAKLRATVRVEIAQIQRSLKLTTIMVTHDQIEAMTMAHRIVLLQDGIIQQVATPIEIYEYPSNMFVAGFVGSPAINFFDISKRSNFFYLDELDTKLEYELKLLQKSMDNNAPIPSSGEFVLGVRPEHLTVNDNDSLYIADAKVRYMERLGSETLIHLTIRNKNMVALMPGIVMSVKSNDIVALGIKPKTCHLFDKTSGARI